MKNLVLFLFITNVVTFVIVAYFIIFPHFYFGLTTNNYLFIGIVNSALLILHLIAYFKTKKIATLIPFLFTLMFYGVLFYTNII